jgi:hypothetical protein
MLLQGSDSKRHSVDKDLVECGDSTNQLTQRSNGRKHLLWIVMSKVSVLRISGHTATNTIASAAHHSVSNRDCKSKSKKIQISIDRIDNNPPCVRCMSIATKISQ